MHTPTPGRGSRRPAHARAFVVALLVLASVLVVISSCGSDDLIFPGMNPPTPTEQNTATPEPDDT